MRTQKVEYAVHGNRIKQPGCGYTDGAKFVLHIGDTAFLFGRGSKRAVVLELMTSGFMFRCQFVDEC